MSGAKYVDGHCHLADPRIASQLERILEQAEARGIGAFVQGGVDPEDWERQEILKRQHPGKIITAFGLHPWWVAGHSPAELEAGLKKLQERISAADAVGEIGLDHGPRVERTSHELQEEAYRRQLDLASRFAAGKPLVLHVVRAHDLALFGLRQAATLGYRGLVHSFSGSKEIAKQYLDLGFHLSISGVITRKGFETLRRAVSYIPLDRLVLETDAPDQKPSEWEGDWNEPVAIFQTAKAVAAIRGTDPEKVLGSSTENLRKLFSIGM